MEELRNRLNCTPCDIGEEEESVGWLYALRWVWKLAWGHFFVFNFH
jgi:hypothetical protein